MKTKKLTAVLISFLLILSLAACGMSKDSKKNEGNKDTEIASLLDSRSENKGRGIRTAPKTDGAGNGDSVRKQRSLGKGIHVCRQRNGNDRGRRQLR